MEMMNVRAVKAWRVKVAEEMRGYMRQWVGEWPDIARR